MILIWKKRRENVGDRGLRQTCDSLLVMPRVGPASIVAQSEDAMSDFKVYMCMGNNSLGTNI